MLEGHLAGDVVDRESVAVCPEHRAHLIARGRFEILLGDESSGARGTTRLNEASRLNTAVPSVGLIHSSKLQCRIVERARRIAGNGVFARFTALARRGRRLCEAVRRPQDPLPCAEGTVHSGLSHSRSHRAQSKP